MSLFTEIATTQSLIEEELERTAKQEGFEEVPEFTERILVDHVEEAVWFQLRTSGYLTWVSNDYSEFAAHGETLVSVDDEEEALSFRSDRQN